MGEAVVLAWRDLSGDPGDVYKFICDSTTQPGVSQTFELVGKPSARSMSANLSSVAYQCMWERKYHKPHDQASDTDLEQFNFAYQIGFSVLTPQELAHSFVFANSLASHESF